MALGKGTPGKPFFPTNEEIADVLERVAELLEAQGANQYRVRAYRRVAQVIERSKKSIAASAESKEGYVIRRKKGSQEESRRSQNPQWVLSSMWMQSTAEKRNPES